MRVKLEDVCSKGSSNLKQSDIIDKNGEYEIYGASGLIGKVDFFHQEKPYIAVVKDGAGIGRTMLLPEKSSVIGTMQYILPNEKVISKYLYYVIRYMHLEKYFTGATIPHIYFKDYRKEEFNLCDLSEQKKIVSTLSKIEEIITHRRIQLEKLDLLVKARFVEMFGGIENKILLKSLCDISGGYAFKSNDISSDGAIKILQIGNVYLDSVNWDTTNYLPEGYDDIYSKFLLNEGDIVIALTRPIIQSLGNVKACIVKKSDMPCLLNQRIGRIVPKENIDVNIKYIYGCLMTDEFTRYVESCSIGCSQPNISTKDIENYLIPDISYDMQMDFVRFKEQVDKSKVAVQKELDKAQMLFDSLMQEYFG